MNGSHFGLVFTTVASITLLSGATSLWLASTTQPSVHQSRILETSSNTWLMGTGAIFGLLGGRTTNSQFSEEEKEKSD